MRSFLDLLALSQSHRAAQQSSPAYHTWFCILFGGVWQELLNLEFKFIIAFRRPSRL